MRTIIIHPETLLKPFVLVGSTVIPVAEVAPVVALVEGVPVVVPVVALVEGVPVVALVVALVEVVLVVALVAEVIAADVVGTGGHVPSGNVH